MAAQDLSWPDFQPPPATSYLPLDHPPSWMINGDFGEFSAAKRRGHRSSISNSTGGREFERFDDETQFIVSMFDNELIRESSDGPINLSSGPAASSSGKGSTNHDKKRCRPEKLQTVKSGHEEVESSTCKNGECREAVAEEGATVSPSIPETGSHETVYDPKSIKRILANKQSARRSRVKKLQYISELERNFTTLQREVSMLSPRLAYLDHQRLILNADNSTLKSKIAALAQDNIFKDAYQEALNREIERLKQVYEHQQKNISTSPTSSPPSSAQLKLPPN